MAGLVSPCPRKDDSVLTGMIHLVALHHLRRYHIPVGPGATRFSP